MTVNVWQEKIKIPTYEIGEPEKYPLFLEKRVYQGSSGSIYPNPVIEKIASTPIVKEWNGLFIENEYIKMMVLPELGGRIHMAYDKIKSRHFIYYNSVIKPALVGLTGPWISGGIEFNWPQHHRPSTYEPIDFCIEENEDGSKTVWVNEIERMSRTKGMAGFTLYPERAYIEVKGVIYNRTPHPQTFLWWANPAVKVNEHYQSVFPPDVNAVFDHGKRDVSEFPIAKGTYYKVDYSPGTDISRYKNIPVPTSYMAVSSKYNFVGGYEHNSEGGLLHVANHHISPGKKQWTWGNGDFGYAWDRNLTDEDGPYIELMCGVYTDNQPDFSWLHPYEEKSFLQYFLPYHSVGVVKNATKEALINLEIHDKEATVMVYVTKPYKNCRICLSDGKEFLIDNIESLTPKECYKKSIALGGMEQNNLTLSISDSNGKVLVFWSTNEGDQQQIPNAAQPAKLPSEIESNEQLYLKGLHLEQYRHATYEPTQYYREALKRNAGDIRCNNALGLWLLRRGKFQSAIEHFNRAIETLTDNNPNPYDGEPFFNRGLSYFYLGNLDKAYDDFFKSCWNSAWQDAGYFNLALIDSIKSNYQSALEHVDKALIKNWHNHKARHLKIVLLKSLGKDKLANTLVDDSLQIDKFNFGALYEKYHSDQSSETLLEFTQLMRNYSHNYLELSLDYASFGQFDRAIEILEFFIADKDQYYPMVGYFLSNFYLEVGNSTEAEKYAIIASSLSSDHCFPNRLEEMITLEKCLELNPMDSNGYSYLGNFWYANRQYEDALNAWEKAKELNTANPMPYRNLSLLYFNKLGKSKLALNHLQKACQLDNKNSRIFMELDQLHKKLNFSVKKRFENLKANYGLVNDRNDLFIEYVGLLNMMGQFDSALALLGKRQFHPWEGGEGKVILQYLTSNIELAKQHILENRFNTAKDYLLNAKVYPKNLGEGKLLGTKENDIDYWLGVCHEGLNLKSEAQSFFKKAAEGKIELDQPTFYNDQQPDKIFYQGLALKKLGELAKAEEIFQNFIDYGTTHMCDNPKIDYFAISLPDLLIWEEDLTKRNKQHCNLLIGLGLLGLESADKALEYFERARDINLYHMANHIHFNMASKKRKPISNKIWIF